jgi:hypothetical protein
MCWGERPPPPSASDAGTAPAGCSATPCPAAVTVTASWVDTQAYCGDHVRLQGTVTPAPPDGPVTVELLMNGAAVAGPTFAVAPRVVGGRIEGTWVAKAGSANWRTDRLTFRVTAPTASGPATSTNAFTFRARPTTAWSSLNVVHASAGGFGPSHEKHDAKLDADKVHYNLKIRLFGAPFGAAKQTAARDLIQNTWNNGFANKKFHRVGCRRGRTCDCAFDCCKAGYQLDVNFVASGEHLAVQVFATAAGATPHRSSMNGNGGEWGDPALSPTTTYAHETGHVLGQADEYATGATDPTGVQPATPAAGEENLMSTPGNTTLLVRHYRFALKFLNDNASGDTYETIQP